MPLKVTHHVTKTETTLSEILKNSFRFSKKEQDALMRLGAIYFEEARVFEDRSFPKGSHLKLYLKPTRYPVNGLKWKSFLVAEEKDFIVVNKPPAVPTHATVDNWYENTLFQMRSLLDRELFVTQRLDTPVKGLLVFAKTKNFQAKFNDWLKHGKVKKTYLAITEKEVPRGIHTHYMQQTTRVPKVLSDQKNSNSDLCQLEVLFSERLESGRYKTEILLLTGRTHQIRAQLSFLGCPIVGDSLYGSRLKWKEMAIGLESQKIVFDKFSF